MALKTGEIRALITGDYTPFKRVTTAAKREAKDTRDELSKPINITGSAAPLLKVLAGLPAAGMLAGAGMAAGLALPTAALAGIGILAVAQTAEVKAAYSDMAEEVSSGVKSAAQPLIPYLTGIADQIEDRFAQVQPRLDDMFAGVGPHLQTLTGGVLDFTENMLPGMEKAIQHGEPVVEGFASFLGQAGEGISDMMTEWADSSDAAGQGLDDLGGTLKDLLGFVGRLTSTMADEFGPRFTQVKDILGDVEDAVVDVADGALPLLSGALEPILDGAGAAIGFVGDLASGFAGLPSPIQAALVALVAWRLMQNRFVGEHASLGDRLSAPWRRYADDVRGALASGEGNVSRMGAAVDALGQRSTTIDRMATAYRTVSSSVEQTARAHTALLTGMGGVDGQMSATARAIDAAGGAAGRFGGAVSGAAVAGLSGLRSAAGGLVNFLGGPWGVVVMGAAAALGVLASRQQAAEQATAQHRSRVASLTESLRANRGVVDQQTKAQQIAEASQKNLYAVAERLGIAHQTMSKAVLGNKAAIDQVNRAWDAAGGALNGVNGSMNDFGANVDKWNGFLGISKDRFGSLARAVGQARRDFGLLSGGMLEAQTNAANVDQKLAGVGGSAELAGQGAAGAVDPATAMGRAMAKMGEAGASAEDKISALKTALDEFAGKKHTVEEANQAVNDTLRGMRDAFKEAATEAGKSKTGLLDTAGAINTTTEAGSRLQDNVMGLADAYRQQYSAAFEAARAQGKDIPEASALAASAASTTRDRFVEVASKFFKTRQEAEKLADQYGLMPGVQATQITQPGMSNAQIAMNLLRDYVVKVPGDKSIIVSSNAAPVIETVKDLGFKVQTLKDGSFKIIADTATAQNQITSFIKDNTGKVITLRTVTTTGVTTSSAGGMKFQGTGQIMEYYGNGGLRPMSASSSAIVAPYTRTGVMRGIGDNPVADEAFIVLQRNNARSQEILDEVLHRMRPEWFSRSFMPMAAGGIWAGRGPGGSSSNDYSRRTSITVNGYSSREVVQQIAEQQRREELLYGAGA